MSLCAAAYEGCTDLLDSERPSARLTPIIAPVRAPHVPHVLDMPLQKTVAIFGSSSDSIPCAVARASTTLSAQYRPEAKDSSADLRTLLTKSCSMFSSD